MSGQSERKIRASQYYEFIAQMNSIVFLSTLIFGILVPLAVGSSSWIFGWDSVFAKLMTIGCACGIAIISFVCIYADDENHPSTRDTWSKFLNRSAKYSATVSQPLSDAVARILHTDDVLKVLRDKVTNSTDRDGIRLVGFKNRVTVNNTPSLIADSSYWCGDSIDVTVLVHESGSIVVAVSNEIIRNFPMEVTADVVAKAICVHFGISPKDLENKGFSNQYV